MKKLILAASFMAITFAVSAKKPVSDKKNVTKPVSKTSVVPAKSINCGTATNGVWSDCWSADVTVTVCCDCEGAVASMLASMSAKNTANKLVSVIEFLNDALPCD